MDYGKFMKRCIYFLIPIILIVSIKDISAQSIISNASFETKTACPTTYGQIHYCSGWASATDATPDYFNNCAVIPVSVPNNFVGWQNVYGDGNGYVGIYAYENASPRDYHEYIMAPLPPLHPGTFYYVSMNIALANQSLYGVDGFGMLFNTHGGYFGSSSSPFLATIPRTPQVDFTSSGVITDTAVWTTLSGFFLADSAYTFVIIGEFKDSAHVDTTRVRPVSGMGYSYYYIDSLQIIPQGVTETEIIASDAAFYPNPLTNNVTTLTFNNPNHLPHCLILTNMLGQQAGAWPEITSNTISISKERLSKGIYCYRLMNEHDIVAYGKLYVD